MTSATYGIIATYPKSGRLGIAIASRSIAAGFSQVHIVPRVGVLVRVGPPEMRPECALLSMLALGLSPATALKRGGSDVRDGATLIALAALDGKSIVWAAEGAARYSGSVERTGVVSFGIGLAGPSVVEVMADSFNTSSNEELDARLLRALEEGSKAGGLVEGDASVAARSAALTVYGSGVHSEIDLRVDLHDDAVQRLRALFDFYKPYEPFYLLRSENPRQTPPQQAFMATITGESAEKAP